MRKQTVKGRAPAAGLRRNSSGSMLGQVGVRPRRHNLGRRLILIKLKGLKSSNLRF